MAIDNKLPIPGLFGNTLEKAIQSRAELIRKAVANPQDATGCCAAINKAIRKGELDTVDLWTCAKCGMEWKPRMVEGIRYWSAAPVVMVWR